MSDFSLRGIIALDTAQLKSGLKDSTNEVKRFSSETGGLVKSLNTDFFNLSNAVSTFGKTFVGLFTVGEALSFIKNTIERFSEIKRISLVTGSNVQDILTLRKMFNDFRMDISDFEIYIRHFTNSIGTALKDSKSDAALMLNFLGLKIDEFKNKSPAEQFILFADAVSKVKDETNKLNIIFEFFGKQSAPVLQLINSYGSDIKSKYEEIGKGYGYFSKKMVEDSNYLAINLHRAYSDIKKYLSEFAYMFAIGPASELIKSFKRGFVKESITDPLIFYGTKGFDAYVRKQAELEKDKQSEREKFIKDVFNAKEKEEEEKRTQQLIADYQKAQERLSEIEKEYEENKLPIEERLKNISSEQEVLYEKLLKGKVNKQLSFEDEITTQKQIIDLEIKRYKLLEQLGSKSEKIMAFKMSPERGSGIISMGGFPDINSLIGRYYTSDIQIKNISTNLIKANVLLERIYLSLKNNAIIIR